jgi:hypothetical protein
MRIGCTYVADLITQSWILSKFMLTSKKQSLKVRNLEERGRDWAHICDINIMHIYSLGVLVYAAICYVCPSLALFLIHPNLLLL